MESQHIRIESDTKHRYEGILTEKLQELRDLYDTEAKQYRDETDSLYSSKVKSDSKEGKLVNVKPSLKWCSLYARFDPHELSNPLTTKLFCEFSNSLIFFRDW